MSIDKFMGNNKLNDIDTLDLHGKIDRLRMNNVKIISDLELTNIMFGLPVIK